MTNLLSFRGVEKKQNTPLNDKSFADKKQWCEQRFVCRSTLLRTKLLPLIGGGSFFSRQRTAATLFSGMALVVQLCR